MNDIQKGYVAGIIDGEAWLGCRKNGIRTRIDRDGNKKVIYTISPSMVIANTKYKLLIYLKNLLDQYGKGNISECKGKYAKLPNNNKCWAYYVGSGVLSKLLPEIKDLLIIKKQQADLIIELVRINQRMQYNGRSRPLNVERRQLEIRAALKKLNKRGRGLNRQESSITAIKADNV